MQTCTTRGKEVATKKSNNNQENHTPSNRAMMFAVVARGTPEAVAVQPRNASKELSQSETSTRSHVNTSNGKLMETKYCVK
mmetsp:Transcript_114112/g.223849  ORF Transcript_114112/g.223849 Transcript_114112/m.223849 type:complete len:81 (+) Transcript_114112:1448-1690(+)